MDRRTEIGSLIAKYGWFIFKIVDSDQPSFAYTVGLFCTYGHPEILISGLNNDVAHAILNSIGNHIKTGGSRLLDKPYKDILEGYDCVFKKVSDAYYDDYLGQAMIYYEGHKIPVFQCVYPDEKGRFPWQVGYYDKEQEILY